MKRRYEGPANELSSEEMRQLRTFLVDVQIVVGFVSHDENVTALDAVDDIVRRTHVETSLPWLPVAQNNSQADQVLAALQPRRDHQGGVPALRRQAEPRGADRGQPPGGPDCVLADLLKTFGANATGPRRHAARRDAHVSPTAEPGAHI